MFFIFLVFYFLLCFSSLNRRLYLKSSLYINNSFYYFNSYLKSFFIENIHFRINYDSTFYILILLNLLTNSYKSVKFIKSDYKFVQEQKSFIITNYLNLYLINQYQNNKIINLFSEKYLQ